MQIVMNVQADGAKAPALSAALLEVVMNGHLVLASSDSKIRCSLENFTLGLRPETRLNLSPSDRQRVCRFS